MDLLFHRFDLLYHIYNVMSRGGMDGPRSEATAFASTSECPSGSPMAMPDLQLTFRHAAFIRSWLLSGPPPAQGHLGQLELEQNSAAQLRACCNPASQRNATTNWLCNAVGFTAATIISHDCDVLPDLSD